MLQGDDIDKELRLCELVYPRARPIGIQARTDDRLGPCYAVVDSDDDQTTRRIRETRRRLGDVEDIVVSGSTVPLEIEVLILEFVRRRSGFEAAQCIIEQAR
nr:hypothetical protein [Rathayibacter tanaceti]